MVEKKVERVSVFDGANLSKLQTASQGQWVEKGANLSRMQAASSSTPAATTAAPKPNGK